MKVEHGVALSRFTTLGTGGPARWFAKPESLDDLQRLLAWARERGIDVHVVGLGSNLLVHDDGVDALVLRLAGELAQTRVEGETLVAGGTPSSAPADHAKRYSSVWMWSRSSNMRPFSCSHRTCFSAQEKCSSCLPSIMPTISPTR